METLEKLNIIANKVVDYITRKDRTNDVSNGILPVHFRYYYSEEKWNEEKRKYESLDKINRMNEYDFFYDNVEKYKEHFPNFYFKGSFLEQLEKEQLLENKIIFIDNEIKKYKENLKKLIEYKEELKKQKYDNQEKKKKNY